MGIKEGSHPSYLQKCNIGLVNFVVVVVVAVADVVDLAVVVVVDICDVVLAFVVTLLQFEQV